jgi:hypothetical protein
MQGSGQRGERRSVEDAGAGKRSQGGEQNPMAKDQTAEAWHGGQEEE